MKSFFYLIYFLCLTCTGSFAYAGAYDDLPAGFRQKWEALLHYAHGKSSISPNSNYFLSSIGHLSPSEELLANLEKLENNSNFQCRFPARYYLLTGTEPSQACTEFQEYKKYVSAEKISLVFAAESTTSPVSSMGHLFLVLEGKNELGINKRHATAFVADTAINNNLLMEFLTDSLVGRYVLNPYDDSIYAYISKEHRSLWEYELFLSNEEKRWLFLHLYELKTNLTQYSFFSHNCANGLNRLLSASSKDFQYARDYYYVTPIEYTKFINATKRVKSITLRPSEEDKLRIRNNIFLDPLKTLKTSRIRLSSTYNSVNKEGLLFEFLPFFSDIEEHKFNSPALGEVQFLKITATGYKDNLLIENLTLVNLRSLPNLQISSLRPNFGLELHGNINNRRTKLYPDIHLGTGFSWGDTGIRPFYSCDIGMQLIPTESKAYLSNQLGILYFHEKYGTTTMSFNNVVSTTGYYRNYKNNYHLSYSNNLFNNFAITIKADLYDIPGSENLKQIAVGIDYRF